MVVLFDIDGTLIDHDGAEASAVMALHAMMQLDEDADAFLRRWRIAFERHYLRYLAGELSLQEQRRERLREIFDPGLPDGDADRLSAIYIDWYLAACRIYEDVEPALALLAAFPRGIISNGDRAQQQYKLEKTGIRRHFGPLIVSGECGIAKPAPGIFKLACDALGVSPSQAVYVGDRRDVDAEAARNAGLHGIWLDRHGPSTDGDPPTRIGSLSELPAALALIERNTSEGSI